VSAARKLLVANRGEIAVRVFSTCRRLGIGTVAAVGPGDEGAFHARVADTRVAVTSYLDAAALVDAARSAGAELVHPGYGFLAESAEFAEAVLAAGLTWIGPPPDALRRGGDKLEAKRIAEAAGVPTLPTGEPDELGFPLLVKAAAGGGGRGMRVVERQEDLDRAIETASREAEAAFGDGTVFCERYLAEPRHVEVQVLGDRNGMRVHLGERDCSVQRRHQKLIEESPAPSLPAETRAGLYRAGLQAAAAVNYFSAGTVEFLVDAQGRFYFIEMNTRIQVEHPVTEMVTGIDLIREQIRIAAGEPLGYRQEDVRFNGHAIECRLNAEDPETFTPSAGRVTGWVPPGGYGVRVDSHLMAPYAVPPFYDSLLGKIIVHAADRDQAIARMRRAMTETVVEGVKTTIPFHLRLLAHPAFVEGRFTSADSTRLTG